MALSVTTQLTEEEYQRLREIAAGRRTKLTPRGMTLSAYITMLCRRELARRDRQQQRGSDPAPSDKQ